jgi:curved DNA-binding protein CbpA
VKAGDGRDPFRALGLAAGRELGDDDIRAAWRRVAAATHPDRADGGDPAAFAAAAAAYTVLRTQSGRGEALADLLAAGNRRPRARSLVRPRAFAGFRPAASARFPPGASARFRPAAFARFRPGAFAPGAVVLLTRIRRGRPLALVLRLLAGVAVCAVAVAAAGWQPASFAIIAGVLTWLAATGCGDLAPPP